MNWKYALHLDVFLANNSKYIVIICATCLKSTLKAYSLIPPEGNTIHEEWTKCYAIFYNVFEDIKEDFSQKNPSIIFTFAENIFWCVMLVNQPLFVLLKIFLYILFWMNTYLFYKELEKKFGCFKKCKVKDRQKVVTWNIEFLSSPFSTFLYEISLSLEIDMSRSKKLLQSDCEQLFHYCSHVYRKFKIKFHRKCRWVI